MGVPALATSEFALDCAALKRNGAAIEGCTAEQQKAVKEMQAALNKGRMRPGGG